MSELPPTRDRSGTTLAVPASRQNPALPALRASSFSGFRLRKLYPFEHGHRLRQVRVKIALQDIEHFNQHRVPKRIKNLVAFLAVHHNLLGAQDGEMLRR